MSGHKKPSSPLDEIKLKIIAAEVSPPSSAKIGSKRSVGNKSSPSGSATRTPTSSTTKRSPVAVKAKRRGGKWARKYRKAQRTKKAVKHSQIVSKSASPSAQQKTSSPIDQPMKQQSKQPKSQLKSLNKSPQLNQRQSQSQQPQLHQQQSPRQSQKQQPMKTFRLKSTPAAQLLEKQREHSRGVIMMASSPSQLSLRSFAHIYDIPNKEFKTIKDVYRFRGFMKQMKIDEGAFGTVSKAVRCIDGLKLAVKEVDLSRKRSKRIEEMKRELFVLQKIDSDYIVKLYEHFVAGNTLVIIMEYCGGGNLTAHLKEHSLGEDETLFIFKQMAAAIKVLHRKGIAHRDVKLNNFLLDTTKKHVKVADFGLSVVSYKHSRGIVMAKTYCGTEPYMAPEILRRNSMGVRSYNPIYADIWSLGVCLFAMLTRTFPFKMNLSQRGLFRAQNSRRWRFPKELRETLGEDLKDLVWRMLDPEPERRITINGVVAHPWLNEANMVNLSHDES